MQAPPDLVGFCKDEYPRLVGLLGLYCGNRALAEDLAQETLVKVCRDWSTVRTRQKPSAWVRRMAINLANSHFRRKMAERRATARLQSQRTTENAEDPQDVVALRIAVLSLPKRERIAIILHFYLTMSFAETAEVMEVPVSTAKSFTSRGLRRLRTSSLEPGVMEDENGHERAAK